jgi:hypothetical protein
MPAKTLTFAESFAGPLVTVYGNEVADFPFTPDHATAAKIDSPIGSPRFAHIRGFRLSSSLCTTLTKPILLIVFGDGEELTQPECGFLPGDVKKWSLPPGTRVLALEPSEGNAEDLLANASQRSHECECSHGVVDRSLSPRDCISVTIHDGKACLNLPVVGSVCVSVPSWVPNGTVAQACIDICSKFGIPCGAKVSVVVAGQNVASGSWGCC